ncbi:hypothetical protein CHCC12620_0851 [Bacillus paralicheniformis]|nr:hypothetical protein CHCC12620_0851 [Bacillus paralicheniformis]
MLKKSQNSFFVLRFFHPISVIENPCSLGRPSIGAERMLERMLEFVSTDAQA